MENVSRRVRGGVEAEPAYSSWQAMRTRCHNPNSTSYPRYGGRGITVCDRWRHSYAAFVEDMGPRPPGKTLHRIDNDGPYSPENCVWADRITQARTSRRTRYVRWRGERLPLSAACEAANVPYQAIQHQLGRGLTFDRAVRRVRDLTAHAAGEVPDVRMCMECFRDLPLGEFYKQKLGHFGRNARCVECMRVGPRPRRSIMVDGELRAIVDLAKQHGVKYDALFYRLVTRGMSLTDALASLAARDRPSATVTEKACTECGATKPLEAFHVNSGGVGGRRSRCIPCQNAVARAQYRARAASGN